MLDENKNNINLKASNPKFKREYNLFFQQIANCLSDLSTEYTLSRQQIEELKEAWFAFGMARVLLQYINLFTYAGPRCRQDLIEALEAHSNKYLDIFKYYEVSAEIILLFRTNVDNLINNLSIDRISGHTYITRETDIIRELASDILQKCQSLFAHQLYNTEAIDKLQASAIALNICNLSVNEQILLSDKLLLIKELWQLENNKGGIKENFKLLFNSNYSQIVRSLNFADGENAFEKIIKIFVDEHAVLQELSTMRLIELYDRLKNYEPQEIIIQNLLHKIHDEAQFRYGYNKLSDLAYELLKRFQSYDTISQQIEHLAFILAESYLLKRGALNYEIIIGLAKHVDNIKAVGANKFLALSNILDKLKQNLSEAENISSTTLNSITNKLVTPIEAHILKRYSELDKFAINSLKNKYLRLFNKINKLLDEKGKVTNFLHKTIAQKLAHDYFSAKYCDSISKLRIRELERQKIASLMCEINFMEMFSPVHPNNITSLNLKRHIASSNIDNVEEYIMSVLNALMSQASAAQLEGLYRELLTDNLSLVQKMLKAEIKKQVKQRTTIAKMLYCVIRGKKDEYNKLQSMRKNLQLISENNKHPPIYMEKLNKIRNQPDYPNEKLQALTQVKNEHTDIKRKEKEILF